MAGKSGFQKRQPSYSEHMGIYHVRLKKAPGKAYNNLPGRLTVFLVVLFVSFHRAIIF